MNGVAKTKTEMTIMKIKDILATAETENLVMCEETTSGVTTGMERFQDLITRVEFIAKNMIG